MPEEASQRKLLVIGSSVAWGKGSDVEFGPKYPRKGWTQMLAKELETVGFEMDNQAIPGTTSKFWNRVAQRTNASQLAPYEMVLLGLSLGNEGLALVSANVQMDTMRDDYLEALHSASKELRKKMPAKSKLVLGGPYPNGNYNERHLQVLEEVHMEMKTWKEVDYVIDFLQPVLHSGEGTWGKGLMMDPGHPNQLGHEAMFKCVDMPELLRILEADNPEAE
eukprot:CAMPEP_0206508632 /NCGR_PEP_ID=MMETSP0324_2-20121206/58457_1 /ASSEMBLY_ACC=CAM_ASM_000836 /TAXON_ID=2866 /ORGANISM="Crypthecodinium cohnii, Strain Seligo" /LENGTH=220 /DNA_ID=CAMNT_0053999551 /DNA_START=319 /DNA_END=981 /DNA_ORIENTATION=+